KNSLLVMLWGNVTLRVQQVMSLRNEVKGDLHQIARNHETIVNAIEAGDVQLAVQLIHDHIGASGDLMAEMWQEEEEHS
ncbi:MAG: FCD domain-containing protein, partial [Chloroflexota bacterium]